MKLCHFAVIKALASSGLRVSKAAEKLNFHVNTVRYHVEKIREETGKDPLDFYDMCELLKEVEETFSKL